MYDSTFSIFIVLSIKITYFLQANTQNYVAYDTYLSIN
jgi:hypothetical protein